MFLPKQGCLPNITSIGCPLSPPQALNVHPWGAAGLFIAEWKTRGWHVFCTVYVCKNCSCFEKGWVTSQRCLSHWTGVYPPQDVSGSPILNPIILTCGGLIYAVCENSLKVSWSILASTSRYQVQAFQFVFLHRSSCQPATNQFPA
jgi:hypothetical protein